MITGMDQLSLDLSNLRDGDMMGAAAIMGVASNVVGVGIQVGEGGEDEEEEEDSMQLQDVVTPSELQDIQVSGLAAVPRLRVSVATDDDSSLLPDGLSMHLADSADIQVGPC